MKNICCCCDIPSLLHIYLSPSHRIFFFGLRSEESPWTPQSSQTHHRLSALFTFSPPDKKQKGLPSLVCFFLYTGSEPRGLVMHAGIIPPHRNQDSDSQLQLDEVFKPELWDVRGRTRDDYSLIGLSSFWGISAAELHEAKRAAASDTNWHKYQHPA